MRGLLQMREVLTTALDALGLLLIAAGVAGGLHPQIGLWSLAVAGVVILAGSYTAAWLGRPAKRPGDVQ